LGTDRPAGKITANMSVAALGELDGAVASHSAHDAVRNRRLALLVTGVGLAASIAFGLRSQGMLQWDDLCRYLLARWAWTYPEYILHDWAHPAFMTAYALPARLGWPAARVLSAVLSAVCAWWAYGIARRLDLRSAWLASLFTFLQPMFFTLSFTTLSETIAAFYVTAAVLLAVRGHWSLSALVLSIAFTARTELLTLMPFWFLAARVEGVRLYRLWPIALGYAAMNLLQWMFGLDLSVQKFLVPRPQGGPSPSGWLTFTSRAIEAWGPALAAMGLAGALLIVRRRGGVLVAGTIIVLLLTQSVIRALGTYLSNGFPRQLVPVSPLIGVAAVACWDQLSDPLAGRRRQAMLALCGALALLVVAMERQFALPDVSMHLSNPYQARMAVRIGAAALAIFSLVAFFSHGRNVCTSGALHRCGIALLMVLTFGYLIRPLGPQPADQLARQAWDWLVAHGYGDRPLVTQHIYFDYMTDVPLPPDRGGLEERIAAAPTGAIVVWDEQFPGWNLERLRPADVTGPAFRRLYETEPLPHGTEPYIRVFEKVGRWPEAPRDSEAPGVEDDGKDHVRRDQRHD
jgi:hypothetical protein